MLNNKILIFLISLGFALISNLANIQFTLSNPNISDTILFGSTIYSPDNEWYLDQIKNYLKGLGFTIDPLDPIYAVRRTPGYPLFYGLHYVLFGESGAHLVIPYVQSVLHAFASVYIFKIMLILFNDIKSALIAAILYGLSPFINSFLFLTITESIFPAMIVFSVYFIVKAYIKDYIKNSIIAGIVFALTVLVSPRCGLTLFFLIPLFFYFNNVNYLKRLKINFIVTIVFILTMSPWVLRNYLLLEKFIPLEAYYLNHTIGGENMKNISLYKWWSTWGSDDRLRLHWNMSQDLDTENPYQSIDLFIDNEVPAWIYTVETKNHLRQLLINYQLCIKISNQKNGGRRLRYLEIPDACEIQVSNSFDSFTSKIKSLFPFQVYIVSPFFRRGFQYIFHSGVHTWSSLENYNGNILKLLIKGPAYILNVLLWFFSFLYLFSSRSFIEKILLFSVPAISFLFIIYYRHVEGRYLLGVYVFLFIMTAIFLTKSLLPYLSKLPFFKVYLNN